MRAATILDAHMIQPHWVRNRTQVDALITEALEMSAGAKLEWHDMVTGDMGTEYFASTAQAQEFWNSEFSNSQHPFGGAVYGRNAIGEWRIDH
jgi:hypothetical protein